MTVSFYGLDYPVVVILKASPSVTSHLPNSTRWLNASHNNVEELTSMDFLQLPHLLELYLDHNQISSIKSNAFQSLRDLKVLDLSWNYLTFLGPYMLTSLTNLHELHLGHNKIAALHPSSLIFQGSLQKLHLPSNHLSSLQEVSTAVKDLLNLTYMDLSFNQISTPCMGPSWVTFPVLRNLSLNSNNIFTLDLSNCSFPNLQQLNLTNNNMFYVMADSFQATPALVELSLDMNPLNISQLINVSLPNLTMLHFSSMKPSMNWTMQLASCTNLTWLDLSTTGNKNLKNGVFDRFQNLEFLSLDKCKIMHLSSSAWGKNMQIRKLILKRNAITQLQDYVFQALTHLSYLDLSKNRLTNLQTRSFFGMAALRTLILQGCQITAVTRATFHYARKMEFLDLRENSIKLLKDHAFMLKHVNTLLIFSRLKKLETLDLSHNHLFTYNKYDYPSLSNLQYLSLKGNPSTFLESLDLSDIVPDKTNSWKIRLDFFQGLHNLSQLWIENSAIWDLPEKVFSDLSALEQLFLSKNKLRNITKLLLNQLSSLKYLDVSDNRLTCSCENAWFQNWSLSEPNIQVAKLDTYKCFGPGVINHFFTDEDLSFCFNDLALYFFSVTTLFTVLFLITTLVYAKFGWTLRHAWFLLRGWGHRQWHHQNGQDYQYDAYISCSRQDYEWVVRNLLEKLEKEGEPGFRFCFGPRDFAPGQYYIDNVQNGISQSRKTLCLVNNNYLESEWCSLEIQLACSKLYYHGQDPLVVVQGFSPHAFQWVGWQSGE
uniref:TIR domain-containing protein n=1 Tax=Varanus komodoensis TaxID=61221 RepID=A0A8D2Q661_VARKO